MMKYLAWSLPMILAASLLSTGPAHFVQSAVQQPSRQCDMRERHDNPPVLLNRAEAMRAFDAISAHLNETNRPGGLVVVGVSLSATGAIEGLEICQPSGYEAIDKLALELVAKLRFSPAEDNGEAVPSQFSIPIRLVPTDLQGARPRDREYIEIPEIIDEG